MFKQIVFDKIFLDVSKPFWLGYVNKFSNVPIEDKTNHVPKETNIEKNSEENSEYQCSTKELSHLLEQSTTYKDVNNKNWRTMPYPKDMPIHQESKTKQYTDPTNTSVLLFPGQGTIKVGHIKKYIHFPAAKELFEIASEILNYNLLKLCLEGPQEKLNKTEFNQPATVVSSLAALEKLREERPKAFESCIATAGYSVGEISALVVSGAISFEDGIRLICIRGKAMQHAADMVPQGMLSVLCTPQAEVYKACKDAEKWAMDAGVENPICRVAIFLHTQRKIIAGNLEALQYIESNKTQLGLTNVNRLPVSGAFHTPLMNPALKSVFKVLTSIELDQPRCEVYSNYTGTPYNNLRLMKKLILRQINSPVKWEQCIQNIYNRAPGMSFPKTFDVGSEGRMRTILKLINAKASDACILI